MTELLDRTGSCASLDEALLSRGTILGCLPMLRSFLKVPVGKEHVALPVETNVTNPVLL